LSWLVGTTLRAVEVDEVGRWTLAFANGGFLYVMCPWRLVLHEKIAISSKDHGQRYGLPGPLDAASELLTRLHADHVTAVSITHGTADVIVAFRSGGRLDVIPFCSGYEAWEAFSPSRYHLIAQGGGQLTAFPAA
jgi:hypothetical protein